MAPRNNDSNTNDYKKKNSFAMDDCDVKDIVPGLLHKKHKVVKLVKGQMQKIQEEGLLCEPDPGLNDSNEVELIRLRRGVEEMDEPTQYHPWWYFIILLIFFFIILLLLMVWTSAGPLSNSIAHTPIPSFSLVRAEGHCSLEKKYLLRWSKPEYYE